MEVEKKNDLKIEFTKGDTYALKITLKKASDSARLAYFTVKDADSGQIVLQKTLGQGISELTTRPYANEYVYKVQIQAEDTANLESKYQYLYDLQFVIGNVVKTIASGFFVLDNTITGVQIITEDAVIQSVDELEAELETTPATNGIEYETDPIANAKIGDMTELNTTNKQTLVDAINESNTTAETAKLNALQNTNEITKITNGTTTVPEATHAGSADSATNATNATNATKVQNVDLSSNNTATFGNYTIRKRKNIWTGTASASTAPSTQNYIDITIQDLVLDQNKNYRVNFEITDVFSQTKNYTGEFNGHTIYIYTEADTTFPDTTVRSGSQYLPFILKLNSVSVSSSVIRISAIEVFGINIKLKVGNTYKITAIDEFLE